MTRTDVAESLFKNHPNEWLYWGEFANRCGALAWRTRISECRTKRGLTIQNRLEHDERGTTHSFYRYVPQS
jgi:hypothetical protein